jgi:flagellar biosynthesis/type III secretory pathway chaperone
MLLSLKKKEMILDEIICLNDQQKECLTSLDKTADEFDRTVEGKSDCIKRLEQLDSGFEKLFQQVAGELNDNREAHKEQIGQMQGRIRRITEKSVKIQAQEVRNRDMMREKFKRVKTQAVAVRTNSRAIQGYYNSMKEW